MVYKLERMQIQMEKENELKKLAEIEGHAIERTKIPDYIDPEFAKEKKYMKNIKMKIQINQKIIRIKKRKIENKALQRKKRKKKKINIY